MRYLSNVTTLGYDELFCTGCGRCAEVCPHGVFVVEGRVASITDRDLCMECGACAMNCASGAITVKAGVGCASAIIGGFIEGKEACCGPSEGNGCC